jgi:hypothetical protein
MLNFDDINEYFDFLCKHQLTHEQFAFMYTLVLDKKDKYGNYYLDYNSKHRPKHTSANVYKYADQVRRWNPTDIDNLVERGLIYDYNDQTGDGQRESYPDRMEVSQTFAELLVAPSHVLGQDLWDNYPNFIYVDEKKVRAKTCDKDELIEKYNNIINGSKKQHKKVMEALDYDKKRNGITMGIEKYVKSRQWEATLEEMEDAKSVVSNNQNQTEIG